MTLGDVPRLVRTIRHLKPSQLYWRGRYALARRLPQGDGSAGRAGGPDASGGDWPVALEELLTSPLAIDELDGRLARLEEGTFEHLNEPRSLGRSPDWGLGQSALGRLWTVTLHYHRWAYELACRATRADPGGILAGRLFEEYVSDWIGRCPASAPGARALAWNAFATATRIGWWAQSALRLGADWWRGRPEFDRAFRSSLWRQADYLAGHVEWDLRANHLLRDAVGLAWAGRFFHGREPRRWLRLATRIAAQQADEQLLPDGGHFERSPMYHLQVMDDLVALVRLVDDPATSAALRGALGAMLECARWMRHPDGGIPQLNDAAIDEERAPGPVFDELARIGFDVDRALPRGGRHFSQTGLVAWRGCPWTLFFDVGPIGPDFQPGHGHADNLTLECSYDGIRLFVDPGTHSYDDDERRAYDRSTAAHNTVCVDQSDSSETWHIFRVGRRARPRDVVVRVDGKGLDATAAHDGYAHLGVLHMRRVQVTDRTPHAPPVDPTGDAPPARTESGGILLVIDRVEGRGRHRVEGGWLLEPGWSAHAVAEGWELERGRRRVRVAIRGPAQLATTIVTRPWHPQFGREVSTRRIVWRYDGPLPFVVVTDVIPLPDGPSPNAE